MTSNTLAPLKKSTNRVTRRTYFQRIETHPFVPSTKICVQMTLTPARHSTKMKTRTHQTPKQSKTITLNFTMTRAPLRHVTSTSTWSHKFQKHFAAVITNHQHPLPWLLTRLWRVENRCSRKTIPCVQNTYKTLHTKNNNSVHVLLCSPFRCTTIIRKLSEVKLFRQKILKRY